MKDSIYDVTNVVVAALQPNELFQIIQFGLAAIMVVIGIAYKIWKWVKEAKADGKIEASEIKEIIEEIKPDVKEAYDDVKEIVDTIKK